MSKENYSKRMGRASVLRVSVAYVGCCIGAGFLSGQELWQFFGFHGKWELAALAVAVASMFVIGALILSLAQDTGETRMDRIIVWFDCKPLRGAVAVFEVVFLFMIYLMSAAAVGSLFAQMLGGSAIWGSIAFCAISTAISLFGVRGLLRFFSMVVPVLIVATIALSAMTVLTSAGLQFPTGAKEGLIIGIWPIDGVVYAIFNLFCALPVLAPLGATLPSGKVARRGIFLGALYLGVLAAMILLSVATDPTSAKEPLPMLALAFSKGALPGVIYAVLLGFGIFSAGLSSQASMMHYFTERFPVLQKKRFLLPVAAGISIAALLLGSFGFRDLVGILYPILGYVGTLPLLLLVVHAVLHFRAKHRNRISKAEK